MEIPRELCIIYLTGGEEEESVLADGFSECFGNGETSGCRNSKHHRDRVGHSDMGSRSSVLLGGGIPPSLPVRSINPKS